MGCSACGHSNPEGARFCNGCGAPLVPSCPACGTENPAGARFCNQCGGPLGDAAAAPASPPVAERSPRDYTPAHLADRILQSKSALEGERKQVTVLFADVKGSTELAEELDPEAWHRILDRFFQTLAEGVHRFEGTVNQYTGDGIMALFGAPIAHEDHAQRACYAALHLQEEIRRYTDELRVSQGLSFAVRMGINSGDVVVGKIGDDLRMDYTAQGATVNLAARMQTLADPGKALLAEATARLVEGYFDLRDLGQTQVRGVAEPVRVAELEGVGSQRTRLDRARARGFSQFVGRARELEVLESALEQALEGAGRVVGVVADAGTGKSRLCDEFVTRCRERGLRIQEAHCPPHGRSMAFLPVLELMRSWFEITERDTDREARRKIAGDLTLLGGDFQDVLPVLFDFLGIADPEQPPLEIQPEMRQRQLYAFVRRLAQARSEREPTVVFIDDLHWIDSGSDAFLAQLVDVTRSTRTLLLVNFRPEYRADWMQQTHYQQLPLVPLGAGEMGDLLRHLLGEDESLHDLPERIFARTGGNPFFAEEIVQSLIESGSLEGESGSYRLAREVERLEIPATVQAVLAARIDRLGELEKRVLQAGAVIGREVPEPLLAAIVDCEPETLATALASLKQLEFLFEHALYPETVYSFKHALTRDVAYESQLQEQRAPLHAAVARALEVREAGRLDEKSGLLAHHWEAAGESGAAARWHLRAAEWAGVADLPQAISHFESVRALLGPEPPDDLAPLVLRACEGELIHGLRLQVDPERLEELFSVGRTLADRLGARDELALLMQHYAAAVLFAGGTPDRAISLLEEAIALSKAEGREDIWLAARYRHAWTHFFAVGFRQSSELFGEICSDLDGRSLPPRSMLGFDYRSRVEWFRMLAEAMRGRVPSRADEGRMVDRYAEEARERGDFEAELSAHLFGSTLARLRGDTDLARTRARRTIEMGEEAGGRTYVAFVSLELGLVDALDGNWEEALVSFERAEVLFFAPAARACRGLAEHRLGRRERGRELSAEAIAMLDERGWHTYYDSHAYMSRIRILLAEDAVRHRAEVEDLIRRQERHLERADLGAEAAQPHLARAELAHALGDAAGRQAALEAARAAFLAVGATDHAARLAEPD